MKFTESRLKGIIEEEMQQLISERNQMQPRFRDRWDYIAGPSSKRSLTPTAAELPLGQYEQYYDPSFLDFETTEASPAAPPSIGWEDIFGKSTVELVRNLYEKSKDPLYGEPLTYEEWEELEEY